MLRQLLRPLGLVAKTISAESSPRQLALGFALGMMIGLVPKGNLIAVVLALLLFGTRVNIGAGLVATVLFSGLSVCLDPASDALGHRLLNAPSLASLWTYVYNLPLMRWSGYNNTVVLGGLCLGAALFYPAYEISRWLFARTRPRLAALVGRYKVTRVLFGANMAANWRMG